MTSAFKDLWLVLSRTSNPALNDLGPMFSKGSGFAAQDLALASKAPESRARKKIYDLAFKHPQAHCFQRSEASDFGARSLAFTPPLTVASPALPCSPEIQTDAFIGL